MLCCAPEAIGGAFVLLLMTMIFIVIVQGKRQMVWRDYRGCIRCIGRRSGDCFMDDAVVVALFRHGDNRGK